MATAPEGTPVTATTTHGALRGTWHDGVARFAGIPFAAPPVGNLRFAPPAPAAAWDGERSADSTAPVSPQNPSIMDALFGGESEHWDEDCLYLNVWTPSPEPTDHLPADLSSLPVMVWIHGGGFEMGSGSSPMYDGTHFARSGVVLVTCNYRLGAFGFLDLSHLDPALAGSGNLGLLDQIAALEWVRDNIAHFGGDPSNVTIFGQSAGAMSVSLLMSMSRATGLFHKAIAQSGAASAARTTEMAIEDATDFMTIGGWSTVDDLRAAPVADLLGAHAKQSAARMGDPESFIRRTGNPLAFLPFRPVADGIVVPADPHAAIAAGSADGVALVVGTTSEEWRLFAMMSPPPGTEDDLRRRLAVLVAEPDTALEAYRSEHPDLGVGELEGAILTDLVFRIPAVRLADAQAAHAPTFQYLWTWQSPAWGGMVGAAHAIEIPFVFNLVEDHRLHVFVGPDAPGSLAGAINDAWVAFAANGLPKADGLPDWPTVDGAGRPVVILDTETALAHDPNPVTRQFWATPAAAMPPRAAD